VGREVDEGQGGLEESLVILPDLPLGPFIPSVFKNTASSDKKSVFIGVDP
jgi:hypothetical protein